MQLNHRKSRKSFRFCAKTYETNQKKGQFRSFFELNICYEIIEFYRYFGLFIWSFYATIRYECKMKNDRQ